MTDGSRKIGRAEWHLNIAASSNSLHPQIGILSYAGWVSLIPAGIDQVIVYPCG